MIAFDSAAANLVEGVSNGGWRDVVAFNGIPFTYRVVSGHFATNEIWSRSLLITPGYSGLEITFKSFAAEAQDDSCHGHHDEPQSRNHDQSPPAAWRRGSQRLFRGIGDDTPRRVGGDACWNGTTV